MLLDIQIFGNIKQDIWVTIKWFFVVTKMFCSL